MALNTLQDKTLSRSMDEDVIRKEMEILNMNIVEEAMSLLHSDECYRLFDNQLLPVSLANKLHRVDELLSLLGHPPRYCVSVGMHSLDGRVTL